MSKRRNRYEPGADVNLPITPMLDMAFQLLMYFIMTYHPSALEGQMDLSMPQKANTQSHDKDKADPMADVNAEKELEIPLDLNVRVIAQTLGYTVTLEESGGNTPMANNDALSTHLQRLFKDKATAIADKVKGLDPKERDVILKEELKKVALKVQADSKVKLGSLMEVMDVCRVAGIKAFKEAGLNIPKLNIVGLSFAQPPDLGIN